MKRIVCLVGVSLSWLGLASGAQAQSGGVNGPVTASAAVQRGAVDQTRAQLTASLLARWSNYIQEVYKTSPEQWASSMAPLFERASIDTLARAASARVFDDMNDELMRGDAPKSSPVVLGDVATRLGDAANDLVFVPISPCRVLDTRVAGGQIAANTVRDFDIADVTNYSAQGGDPSNCSGLGAAGSFAAIAINLTVVAPAAAGFISAFPFNTTRPLAATLVYATGDILSNLAIVRLDQTAAVPEMSVYTFATAHLVGDVVGYFITPQATALDCTQTFATTSRTAGQTFNLAIPACPAGYTMTGAGCRTPGFNDATWAINGLFRTPLLVLDAFCSGQANVTTTIEGTGQCCRVPGR